MNSHPTPATRASWSIRPCPDQRATLAFGATYSPAEFERIKAGLLPVQMEDKWFMFFEEPWLYMHRSWTGFCIYGVRFESSEAGVTAVEAWVSRDADQYRGASVADEEALLKFLIDALVLSKMVPFPVPQIAAGTPPGLYQHAVAGRAYPEVGDDD